ncbi:MAG TPA: decarboxylating 6-phosphogluconate dehydrogenase [Alcaligenaceae bacterium]|nr:decarboxylating 6-phosphogluconate dehydrogenase [Alcaligenaceae bacterium]
MQLGMIGLGRMGSNMVQRLLNNDIACVIYDAAPTKMTPLQDLGATATSTLDAFVAQLNTPRIIWLMVPAAVVDTVLAKLSPLLSAGDMVIDGGNSHYKDTIRRSATLRSAGIHYVDVGTSGGVFGLERGYCLMIGGEQDIATYLDPIFSALAPGESAVPKTSGRATQNSTSERGYLYCGPSGAGHFVKMVHNGIEYGMMAAYAEGMNLLKQAQSGGQSNTASTSAVNTEASNNSNTSNTVLTSPFPSENPPYAFDLPEIAEVWRRGSVISSWLLDLTAHALHEDPNLEQYSGHVSDSGEGRWMVMAALEEAVPVPVLSAALYARFSSRGQADFANKILSAMRHQFGGHLEPPSKN